MITHPFSLATAKWCWRRCLVTQRQENSFNRWVRDWSYETKSKLLWKHLSCTQCTVRMQALLVGREENEKMHSPPPAWWRHIEPSFGKDKLYNILPDALRFAGASISHWLWLGIHEWKVPTSSTHSSAVTSWAHTSDCTDDNSDGSSSDDNSEISDSTDSDVLD